METKDPIQHVENIVKSIPDQAEKHAQPVLSRYPLTFAFLVTFSVAAIMEGFKGIIKEIPFFQQYPFSLIVIGMILLLLTGTLYKSFQKH